MPNRARIRENVYDKKITLILPLDIIVIIVNSKAISLQRTPK